MIDVKDLKDESLYSRDDLETLRIEVVTEIERREAIERIPQILENQALVYQKAIGRKNDDLWEQPTGAHDAYFEGAKVRHNDKEWVSLISSNVWEPGVTGWREVVPEPEPGQNPTYPEWVQPLGGHDAYNKGALVSFKGSTYESVMDGNVWSPEAYPAGWKKL